MNTKRALKEKAEAEIGANGEAASEAKPFPRQHCPSWSRAISIFGHQAYTKRHNLLGLPGIDLTIIARPLHMEDPSTKLPQELLDHIIDELSSDHTTLKQCALSFRSLRFRSQSHLFAEIYFASHLACKRLHSVLTDNASIAPHVHNLTISLYSSPRLIDDEVLPIIFDMLTSLREFTLHGTFHGRSTWTSIPECTKLSLFRLFSLPTLLTIRLTFLFDIPVTFFQIPNTLERLILQNISFDGVLHLDNSPSLFFRSLSLPYDTTGYANMLPNSCFLHMSELCSKLGHDNLPTLVHIMKMSARSLTSLKLTNMYTNYASLVRISQFRLPSLQNLKFISFCFKIYYSSPTSLQHNGDVVIQQLISFLAANADAVRVIETFTIMFMPLGYDGTHPEARRLPNILSEIEHWNDLDKAIYTHCVLPGLRVGLVLILDGCEPLELVDRRKEWQELTLRDTAKRDALEKTLLNRFIGLAVQRDVLKQKKDNEGVERVQREIDGVKKDLEAINHAKKDEAAYIPAYLQFMAGGRM
ncbi:hypothetical protein Hypma_002923 [Hypsizygus marmoreus]|uniref:F-box domain-containing protein n=1 Tax=Hypsizygus marmoreus TaxID=39966 RepID=A0A369J7P7_HYPMA|nr:hypothetical protein Hypma_002923 [Hypsizygus marmoreus]